MIKLTQNALFLAAALALAACNTTTGDQPGPAAAAGTTGAAGTTASAAPADDKPAQPMTRTEAASQCWMKAEKLEGDKRNIDSRLSYVEKCIGDKMKTAQPAAPKT